MGHVIICPSTLILMRVCHVGDHPRVFILFIIYQCYVYRTNIRHIPPEVACECDTTSVIRRVWYDECDTMSVIWVWYDAYLMGEKKQKFFFEFFFEFFLKIWNFCWIFFNICFQYFFSNFFLIILFYFFATSRHTEHCALLVFLPHHVTQSIVHCLLCLTTQAICKV